MAERWMVRRPGEQPEGPVDGEQLVDWIVEEEIDHSARVKPEGEQSWEPLWRVDPLLDAARELRKERYPEQYNPVAKERGPEREPDDISKISSKVVEERERRFEGPGQPTGKAKARGEPDVSEYSFNWGAFLLSPFWAIAHQEWWVVVLYSPLAFWLVMEEPLLIWVTVAFHVLSMVYYGLRGWEVAWNSDRFAKLDECVEVQHHWRVWGFGLYGLAALGYVGWWFFNNYNQIYANLLN